MTGLAVGSLGLMSEPLLLSLWHDRRQATRQETEAAAKRTLPPATSVPTIAFPIVLAIFYGLIGWRYGSSHRTELLLACVYTALLYQMAIIDFHTRLVMNILSYPAAVIGIGGAFFWSGIGVPSAVLGGAVALAFFLVIEMVGRGAMGRGDTKLAAVIGFMRGFPAVWQALIVGVLVGGLWAILLLVSGQSRRSTFAYGPSLAIGTVISMLLTIR